MLQRIADEIRGQDSRARVDTDRIPDEIRAIVARREQDVVRAVRPALAELDMDGVNQGLLAHRLDDAGRTEDGNAADDAEAGVERLFRECLALRHEDDDGQTAAIIAQAQDLFHVFADHAARDGIDGRRADRLVEPALCNAAYARAAVDRDAGRFRPAHGGKHQRVARDVRIVAAVLADGAGDGIGGSRDLEHVQRQGDALWREQIDGSFFVAGQEHPGRRFRGGSRAGAGRIAETELFSVLDDVFFHLSAGSGRASRCRSRRRHCCRPCVRARRYRVRGSSR